MWDFIFGLLGLLKDIRKPGGKLLKVYDKEGSIYGVYKDGSERQLTHSNQDEQPLLVKVGKFPRRSKLIIFLRAEPGYDEGQYGYYKFLSLDPSSLKENIILDQKSFWDGNDGSYNVLSPRNIRFWKSRYLLFNIEKWATGDALVSVDIKAEVMNYICPSNNYDIIKGGKFKDNFLIVTSDVIAEKGRHTIYQIRDFNGSILKQFHDYDDYMTFRANTLIQR